MKQVLFSILAMLLGLGIMLVSALHVGQQRLVGQAGAQVEEGVEEREASSAAEVVPSPISLFEPNANFLSDYYLPYPGILPDHPFYWLKMLRDRVLVMVEWEPRQKLERVLLLADKRIGAALVLAEGNKQELAGRTALKAEQYLQQAAVLARDVEDPSVAERLAQAAAKHEEVLLGIRERMGDVEGKWAEEAEGLNGLVKDEYQANVQEMVVNEEIEEGGGRLEASDEVMIEPESPVESNVIEEEFYPVEIGL